VSNEMFDVSGNPSPGLIPELPYAGSSGWSGSETSRVRAEELDRSGGSKNRQNMVIRFLRDRAATGATWKELGEEFGWHHGNSSSVLSILHKTYHIDRLEESRLRCKVYVTPEWVNSRVTELHRGNIRGQASNVKEMNMLTEAQATILIDGQPTLVHKIERLILSGGNAEQVVSAVADWLTTYRPVELEDLYCTPLDVTAFILRRGELK